MDYHKGWWRSDSAGQHCRQDARRNLHAVPTGNRDPPSARPRAKSARDLPRRTGDPPWETPANIEIKIQTQSNDVQFKILLEMKNPDQIG